MEAAVKRTLPPGFLLATLLSLVPILPAKAEEARLTLLPIVPPGAGAAAVTFADHLRRALSAPEAVFGLAATPFDADVLVEIRGAGPAGYRRGAEPGTRLHLGCLVLAQVTSRGSLPTEIQHRDVGCPEAADALLLSIERLVRGDWNEGSAGL
jgi:hypothetical protein